MVEKEVLRLYGITFFRKKPPVEMIAVVRILLVAFYPVDTKKLDPVLPFYDSRAINKLLLRGFQV